MKIYIKPPNIGVFAPRTKTETKLSKRFSSAFGGKSTPVLFLVIDYGKIGCIDGVSYHWCHEDYYSRKVPKK